ncbi:nucleoside triphosphate pyrophosphohydrolase [Heliorestis acidaminivorans]|uniref:Nucleoside triphosphate pyrophosphohydrolase n=1 Tax=Heliorestis acidaminivorans TaxID=553427 RepID=A0A6I0F6W8_9FIRM|nr:nucleoside triphosphate pyrophosphohydrolase [Heliorestis acidaminivorans]KAB2953042.1 nucleoside triphosphate pyrophosphohydrolase [Heliorestis acidaminivorans]
MAPAIIIVGLGAGSPGHITLAGWQALCSARRLFLRTSIHPTVKFLEQEGLSFRSFDDLYEEASSFETLYHQIAEILFQEALESPITFAVPGHPFVGERVVTLLVEKAEQENLEVQIIGGTSFLEALYPLLKLDPSRGLLLLDALAMTERDLLATKETIVTQIHSTLVASDVKLTLMEVYPDDHEVVVVRGAGIEELEKVVKLPLYELDHLAWIDHLTSLYVPALPQESLAVQGAVGDSSARGKYSKASLSPLVDVMVTLLGPDGCPWDRKQTHQSLKPYLLEESYEVLEAIDQGDRQSLQDELGDVLLQVVFHSLLAEQKGHFQVDDVIRSITEKMIRRHPHVFGDVTVNSADDVVVNWEAIKAEEKAKQGLDGKANTILDAVSLSLPALMRAEKVQKKASTVGFDWEEWQGARDKVEEEWQELLEAIELSSEDAVREELGDLLFAVVNLSRFFRVNSEEALQRTTDKFVRRLQFVEQACRKEGKNLTSCTLEELDRFWEEAKKGEM